VYGVGSWGSSGVEEWICRREIRKRETNKENAITKLTGQRNESTKNTNKE